MFNPAICFYFSHTTGMLHFDSINQILHSHWLNKRQANKFDSEILFKNKIIINTCKLSKNHSFVHRCILS